MEKQFKIDNMRDYLTSKETIKNFSSFLNLDLDEVDVIEKANTNTVIDTLIEKTEKSLYYRDYDNQTRCFLYHISNDNFFNNNIIKEILIAWFNNYKNFILNYTCDTFFKKTSVKWKDFDERTIRYNDFKLTHFQKCINELNNINANDTKFKKIMMDLYAEYANNLQNVKDLQKFCEKYNIEYDTVFSDIIHIFINYINNFVINKYPSYVCLILSEGKNSVYSNIIENYLYITSPFITTSCNELTVNINENVFKPNLHSLNDIEKIKTEFITYIDSLFKDC